MQGVTARSLLEASERLDMPVVIADVVREELRKIVQERLDKFVAEVDRLERDRKNLGLKQDLLPSHWPTLAALHQALEGFDQRVEFLTKRGSMPYPAVASQELASRSIFLKRPFSENDKGLRDTLLWLSIIEHAHNTKDTYLLVSNDGIFGDDAGLHRDLESELRNLGLEGRVLLRKSLSIVLNEFVKPQLTFVETVEVAIKSGGVFAFTDKDDSVSIAIFEYLLGNEIPDDWYDNEGYGAEVDVVEDVVLDDVVSTLGFEDDPEVLVTSTWLAIVHLIVNVSRYIEDSAEVAVRFTVESLIDAGDLSVKAHEVTETELTGWIDRDTGERIPL